MQLIRTRLPLVVALLFGWLTLLGFLLIPALSATLLSWAALLAAVALLLGVLNLALVHLSRARGSPNSIFLLLAMLLVFTVAVLDALGITENVFDAVFHYFLVPLEAALASLLAFFLLFIGMRVLGRGVNVWSALFLVTAVFLLISQSPLPGEIGNILAPVREAVNAVLVSAGMRGILLGVALGLITLSIRVLAGLEQPYNR